ncbi:hypothetical protein OH492_09145 [Vibrio chagasii]|nr:hypothetical protein [Vibrio chagasii]
MRYRVLLLKKRIWRWLITKKRRSAVSQTETITFTNQSDDVEKFRLEPTEFNTGGTLKSDGLVIEIREEPAGSGNYIGFTTDTSNVETTVFTAI